MLALPVVVEDIEAESRLSTAMDDGKKPLYVGEPELDALRTTATMNARLTRSKATQRQLLLVLASSVDQHGVLGGTAHW